MKQVHKIVLLALMLVASVTIFYSCQKTGGGGISGSGGTSTTLSNGTSGAAHISDCPIGTTWNAVTHRCESAPSCPQGYHWDIDECVPDGVVQPFEPSGCEDLSYSNTTNSGGNFRTGGIGAVLGTPRYTYPPRGQYSVWDYDTCAYFNAMPMTLDTMTVWINFNDAATAKVVQKTSWNDDYNQQYITIPKPLFTFTSAQKDAICASVRLKYWMNSKLKVGWDYNGQGGYVYSSHFQKRQEIILSSDLRVLGGTTAAGIATYDSYAAVNVYRHSDPAFCTVIGTSYCSPQDYLINMIAHELGHTLGLLHAAKCNGTGVINEYNPDAFLPGGNYAIMGNSMFARCASIPAAFGTSVTNPIQTSTSPCRTFNEVDWLTY